jgi:hypothetical protein
MAPSAVTAIDDRAASYRSLKQLRLFLLNEAIILGHFLSDAVFLNIYGAQNRYKGTDSASLCIWRAGTTTLFLLGA